MFKNNTINIANSLLNDLINDILIDLLNTCKICYNDGFIEENYDFIIPCNICNFKLCNLCYLNIKKENNN